jgi:hypothetical protein
MPGRLNIFQRTMLQWNDLHPYNAVHVVQVPALLNLERLRDCLRRTLESHGLTGLTLDRDRGIYHYHGGPAEGEFTTVTGSGNTQGALADEIRRQLNTPFAWGERVNPFRFFVLPAGGSFYLGVAYFHAVAGAESLVLLIQDIVNTFLGRDERGLSRPVELYPDSYGGWLRRHPGVLFRKLASLPALFRGLRRSCRPCYRDAQDLGNGFDFFSLTSEDLHRLRAAGKSWGFTLNDLFLALLLKALSPLAADRSHSTRRKQLSVGSIVNIRKDLGVDSRRTFGLFLGSFVVTHAVPEGISVKALAADIHRQTLRIKQTSRYMGTPVDLACARFMLSFLSIGRKKKFHQKYYPLWGGVTNMNLNTVWPQSGGERPIDYLRAVSTGPATPLVLSITTVRDVVNIGLSFRTTVFSPADIERVKSEFVNLLKHLEDPS